MGIEIKSPRQPWLLLKKAANAKKPFNPSSLPLNIAVDDTDVGLVEFLLKSGANVNDAE